jgi:hypothetical protein
MTQAQERSHLAAAHAGRPLMSQADERGVITAANRPTNERGSSASGVDEPRSSESPEPSGTAAHSWATHIVDRGAALH